MSKNWSWKGTELTMDKKFACSDNPGQNTWNKLVQSSKTGQEQKILVSVFVVFLMSKSKFLKEGLALGFVSIQV